ncbi:MAG: hypothetical protein IJ386_01555 [Clostridia bacterium]|nr:hypothetical protein [Clostridia bacterium]
MVYQRSFYRATDSTYEKMRSRNDGRIKYAFRDSGSENQAPKNQKSRGAKAQTAQAETRASGVMNFFGMAREEQAQSRSIPSRKRANARAQETASENVRRGENPRAKQASGHARPRNNARQQSRTADRNSGGIATGLFARAYNNARPVREISKDVYLRNKSIHKRKTMSEEELKSRISRVPGSRAATLKTELGDEANKSKLRRFLDSFRDNRKAEHRVKSSPFPFSYVAIIAVCAIMATVLLLSYTQINEYEKMISVVDAEQAAEDEKAGKLELQVEYREDIRNIQDVAVNYLGMVNSDVARTDFVSVPSEDKVSILKVEEEEKEGGLSALLSAIGEGIGKFSEYFN